MAAGRRSLLVAVAHTEAAPLHIAAGFQEDLDRTAARRVEERRTGLVEVRHIGLLAVDVRIDLPAAERRIDLVVAVRSLVDLRTEAAGRSHRLEGLEASDRRS